MSRVGVDIRFRDAEGVERTKHYEAARYEDAVAKFYDEFPDETTRPAPHGVRVDNRCTADDGKRT